MRKSFIKKIASMVMMTTMAVSFVYPTYANTNVPTNVSITGDNLFDGTAGISISIPDSMPLTVNEDTGNYEFEDFVSASGAVYHDQNLTVAIPNGTVQYMTNNDESTALTGTVGFCDDSGEFVKFSEGNSYEGLPDFPTSYNVTGGNTYYWIKFTNYVLYSNKDQSTYYLLCLNNDSGQLYLGQVEHYDGNSYILSNGTCTHYNSSRFDSIQYSGNSLDLWCYKYTVGDSDWTMYSGYSAFSINKFPKIVQSSSNIYTDSTCSEIYFKGCKNPYAATNGTYVEISANDIVENYKEIQSGTESSKVTNKNKMKIIVNPGDINYLGDYTGTVIFETTLSEHVEN